MRVVALILQELRKMSWAKLKPILEVIPQANNQMGVSIAWNKYGGVWNAPLPQLARVQRIIFLSLGSLNFAGGSLANASLAGLPWRSRTRARYEIESAKVLFLTVRLSSCALIILEDCIVYISRYTS